MRGGGQGLESGENGGGQAAQGLELFFVGLEFVAVRKVSVDEQVGDLLEFAMRGEVHDVVAAVVQVVSAAADRAERGVAGGNSGKGDGFLGFERGGGRGFAHGVWDYF